MKAGIALGSNLGDRDSHMQAGFNFLKGKSSTVHFLCSSIISTEPVDCPPGAGIFLNAAAEIDWEDSPHRLLALLQGFEQSLGRAKLRAENSPRPLDLDIIYFGNIISSAPDLILPHPRAIQREFVLKPLAEIRPDLVLPGQTKTVKNLLLQLNS